MLESMGYVVEVMSCDIDEKAVRRDEPNELALALAHAKADAIVPNVTGPAILITYDSVAIWGGTVREKPESEAEARQFLADYQVQPVQSASAVVVTDIGIGKRIDGVDNAETHFKAIPPEAVDGLIADGCVFGCAGGFCVQHPLFEPWIEKIVGEKESVAGLPITLTKRLLSEIGI
jgi:septum formation protein